MCWRPGASLCLFKCVFSTSRNSLKLTSLLSDFPIPACQILCISACVASVSARVSVRFRSKESNQERESKTARKLMGLSFYFSLDQNRKSRSSSLLIRRLSLLRNRKETLVTQAMCLSVQINSSTSRWLLDCRRDCVGLLGYAMSNLIERFSYDLEKWFR